LYPIITADEKNDIRSVKGVASIWNLFIISKLIKPDTLLINENRKVDAVLLPASFSNLSLNKNCIPNRITDIDNKP
jgi:hypothetical protein